MNRIHKAERKKRVGFFLLLTISFFFLFLTCSQADDEATAGRKIVAEWQNSVITLKMVIRTRMAMAGREMNKSENKSEVTATVIDPSGLAVFSLSASNPGGIFEKFMVGAASGEAGEQFKMESEVTELTMRLVDGREIPGTIVMRDKDLDLAFVRPTAKLTKPILALDLSQNAKAEVLESVIFLSRMGKEGGWVPSVTLDRIKAIVNKPRIFYVPGDNISSASGCPVFNLNGKVIGILLLRISPSFTGAEGMGFGAMFGGMSNLGIFPVILPANDILVVAKQIPAAN